MEFVPFFYMRGIMKAEFGIKREQQNNVFYKEYKNDAGIFHFHSQIELYFVDDGEMEVIVNSNRRILKKGEMSVALSYDAHAYKTPEYSRSSVLIIPPFMCEEFMAAIKNKRVVYPFIDNLEAVKKIKSCINEIKRENSFAITPDNINPVKLIGYIYVILATIMESLSFKPSKESIDPQLSSRILFYLNENFKNDVNLSLLSSEFGYSQSYISQYFKSCFNIGINQYITTLRLKSTLMLIQEKKHSLTYCAMESGFNSMRTFYRAFYNEFGCTPKEYINKNI